MSEAEPTRGRVALLRLEHDPQPGAHLRTALHEALEAEGYAVTGIARTSSELAASLRCDAHTDACREAIARDLETQTKQRFDYYVWGEAPTPRLERFLVWDLARAAVVVEIEHSLGTQDYVWPLVFGPVLAARIRQLREPVVASEAELAALAALDDEPPMPPLPPLLVPGCSYPARLPIAQRRVDLDRDFEDDCRNSPRDDPAFGGRDLRPVCKRGPVFGYFQPASWTLLALSSASLLGMATSYTLATAGPDSSQRAAAWTGHALAGLSVGLGTALVATIVGERKRAKQFIQRERELNLAINPLEPGASFELRF